MSRVSLVILFFFAYTALAVNTDFATTTCKQCFSATLAELLRSAWTTFETALRGFLLGFGAAILKDLLVDGRASADAATDFHKTMRFARVVGLGSASFLVGVAIFLPAQWRYDLFQIK